MSDLLATDWADNHCLPEWEDAAASVRDRLWRRDPHVLEKLTSLASAAGGSRERTG